MCHFFFYGTQLPIFFFLGSFFFTRKKTWGVYRQNVKNVVYILVTTTMWENRVNRVDSTDKGRMKDVWIVTQRV